MLLYLAGNMRPDIVYDREDPIPVKSRTRYVITFTGWPLTRKIKLQSLVAVYIKEAEYIALSHCMRELIPLRRLTREVGEVFGIPEGDLAIHFSTKLQKADIFTKGLGNVKFKELRELLVGW